MELSLWGCVCGGGGRFSHWIGVTLNCTKLAWVVTLWHLHCRKRWRNDQGSTGMLWGVHVVLFIVCMLPYLVEVWLWKLILLQTWTNCVVRVVIKFAFWHFFQRQIQRGPAPLLSSFWFWRKMSSRRSLWLLGHVRTDVNYSLNCGT